MTRLVRACAVITVIAALAILYAPAAYADDNDGPVAVTVSFGAGLNTAQPGNSANHHVLPGTIHVRAGGVVNFNVAGFHQIFVYNPGKGPKDIVPNPDPTSLFINDLVGTYYRGIAPAVPPAGNVNPSNAINRLESVSFSTPGRYLVICNVAPHFADGMWAWIVVTGGGDHDH